MSHDLSDEKADDTSGDWARVKSLWFAVQDAAPDDRNALLSDPAIEHTIREQVRQLLDASERAGDRFDLPAIERSSDESARMESPAVSLVGRRLGPFDVVRRIGVGGMGAVYEGVRADDAFRQRVALKTIWRGADSDVLLHRFRSERQILAGLQHPNIALLLDGGATAEGTPWLAMEYVDGVPIDTYCDEARLALPARLDLFRQVCGAVQFAHRNLVVHRDLKPSNVLVTRDGTVKLLDFGVAKLLDDPRGEGTLTGAGLSPFTVAYAAPEQISGARVSTATDVYALGALLVTLLVGRPPRTTVAPNANDSQLAMLDRPVRAPSAMARDGRAGDENSAQVRGFATHHKLAQALEGELDAIALMALRSEPERRYASADALSDDVHRYLRRERVHARPDTVGYRVRAFVRRRRPVVIGGVATLLAVVGGSAVALWQANAIRAEAARSERVSAFMARLVSGSDGATDPLARLGPRGTIAQMLDSALRRVPREFPNDARIRARLYTAIGTNLSAQGRLRDAAVVLDSAAILARTAYAPNSDAYVEASLERANVVFVIVGPDSAEIIVRGALRALSDRKIRSGPLYTTARVLLATARQELGALREADSIAHEVLAEDARNAAPPSINRARAIRVLTQTGSWIHRDPRIYLRECRHLVALTDSIGALMSLERFYAVSCEVNGLLTLGRVAEADSVLLRSVPQFRTGYSDSTPAMAIVTVSQAAVAGAKGDTAEYHRLAARAWEITRTLPDATAEQIALAGMERIEAAWSSGAYSESEAVALAYLERTAPFRIPLHVVFANLYLGMSRLQLKEFSGAERAFRAGLAALPQTHDLDSMLSRLRAPLAEALVGQGRTLEADSVRALVPPRSTVPPCSPGGNWKGCPMN